MNSWKIGLAAVMITLFIGLSSINCNQSGGTLGSSIDTGGTIALDVSATSFPFNGVESATMTIVRIDALPAGATQCESECDDGLFCNGLEVCVDGECRAGISPCTTNQSCDEETNECLNRCVSDADCNDGIYCNGAEICRGGLCATGPIPCGGGFYCVESNHSCSTTCKSDAQCDDGVFCNGAEKCVGGACAAAAPPCAMGEICDEAAGLCKMTDSGGTGSGGNTNTYVVLFEGEKIVSLTDVQALSAQLLSAPGVSAGDYKMIRFFVSEGDLSLSDGRTFKMIVPNGAQTGIKVRYEFSVSDGYSTPLLLQIDSNSAFRRTRASGSTSLDEISGFTFAPASALQLSGE
ncbi:MAG: DUF4382 domain-containing protein [Planctomycetes bacterium]|nr:DUF4382 domain-containing protein [Planctomycetota bacterium]MBI3834522.1 DUF4382 domain-containing protein [Planctomycetota bacterium]